MKSFLICGLFISTILPSCSNTLSKSNQGLSESYLLSKRVFAREAIEQFKKSTTVFFYGRESGKALDSLKEAITMAWKITPILFEPADKYGKYAGEAGFSCFIIEGGVSGASFVKPDGKSFDVSNTHLYLALRPYREYGLCRIELYPDSKTLLSGDYDHYEHTTAYKKGYFYNWSPVYLSAHLGRVATNLENNNLRPDLMETYKDPRLSELLSNDTLYVSDELLNKFNSFSGKEKSNEKTVFESYKFPYRICNNSELFEIFITQKRGRFLFEYVKSSTLKFIKIFDMKKRELVYAATDNGYNLKPGDMSAIK